MERWSSYVGDFLFGTHVVAVRSKAVFSLISTLAFAIELWSRNQAVIFQSVSIVSKSDRIRLRELSASKPM